MNITYRSTRSDSSESVTASYAILKGLADDGGLFVPVEFPVLDTPIEELAQMSYQEVAFTVLRLFLSDFSDEEIRDCVNKAYDEKFDTDVIAPISYADGAYYLELYHGRTIAFKDMALSILPHFMRYAAKKNNISNEIVILTATSGDTGKAALAGFADVPGTRIVVFYPKDGVSPVQERQMVTQKGSNTFVVGIRGNFDDAQTAVKRMFSDQALGEKLDRNGFMFSSANSINIGRLLPQVVYYVYAYAALYKNGRIKAGEPINVTVPTGNFGNILAAYFAKKIGTPIDKLICASNKNKVLTDFFHTGNYDRNRDFYVTSSPSMDILVSSNLERLIYLIDGRDPKKTAQLMAQLGKEGSYDITDDMRGQLSDFYADFATEEETQSAIRELYRKTGYVIDTHTAVASSVYGKYVKASGDTKPTVIASTASPYKFARSVVGAIKGDVSGHSEIELIDMLTELSGVAQPPAIIELKTAPIVHKTVCDIDKMNDEVLGFLGIRE